MWVWVNIKTPQLILASSSHAQVEFRRYSSSVEHGSYRFVLKSIEVWACIFIMTSAGDGDATVMVIGGGKKLLSLGCSSPQHSTLTALPRRYWWKTDRTGPQKGGWVAASS